MPVKKVQISPVFIKKTEVYGKKNILFARFWAYFLYVKCSKKGNFSR